MTIKENELLKEDKQLKVEMNRLRNLLKSLPKKYRTKKKRQIGHTKTKKQTTPNKNIEEKIDMIDNKVNVLNRQLALILRILIPIESKDALIDDSTSIDSRATDDLIG